jgi:hypothetical protein
MMTVMINDIRILNVEKQYLFYISPHPPFLLHGNTIVRHFGFVSHREMRWGQGYMYVRNAYIILSSVVCA